METQGHNKNGPESFVTALMGQVLLIWPRLAEIKDEIELIYAGFHSEFAFHSRCTDGLTEQIVNAYNNGKRYMMFECMGEGIPFDNIERIHNVMDPILKNHPDITVCYLTGVADGQESYNRVCKKLGLDPYIKIYNCFYFEALGVNRSSEYFTKTTYDVRLRDKNYLCFNKLHRQHRIDLLESLLQENLVNDKCYYSFQDYTMPDNVLDTLVEEYYPNITKNRDLIDTLSLNPNPDRFNPVDIILNDVGLFENSYFSIVTETLFYGNDYPFPKARCHVSPVEAGAFFTEKTNKPLIMLHPFILVTTHNSMRFLHDRGYKTFHPYIDESYDSIKNDDLRMKAIVEEVKRLCSKSDDEWLEWCQQIKPIVEHNRKTFFEQINFAA